MDSVLEGSEHLERELTATEPIAAPAAGALGLHVALLAFIAYYAWVLGLFHHNMWGNPGAGGPMQVTVVTALPLPPHEVNNNVLATETPSPAPAEPSKKEEKHVDETAIPIAGKPAKPKPQTTPKTQMHQPQPRQNVAQYGEQQGSVMPHQMQVGSPGPTTVGDNNFASLFPWYVDQINRKMSQSWDKAQVDPRTPKGARVFLVFTISKDGSHGRPQLDTSSGSPTLDNSCMRAAQRVTSFGPLPQGYNESTLMVGYYCEY